VCVYRDKFSHISSNTKKSEPSLRLLLYYFVSGSSEIRRSRYF
jgi:hypothetical protein